MRPATEYQRRRDARLWTPRDEELVAMPTVHGLGLGLPNTGYGASAGAPAFTPADLGSKLRLWLEADTPNIINTGSGVSQWTDLSGNGNHALQSSDPSRPTFVSSGGSNNTGYVQNSNAAGDSLVITDAASLKPSTISIFLVAYRTESNAFRVPFSKTQNSAWGNGFGIHTDTAGTALSFFVNNYLSGGVATTGAGNWPLNTWNIWHCRYNNALSPDTTTVLIDRDQGAATYNNTSGYSSGLTTPAFSAGVAAQVTATPTLYFGGRISFIAYSEALTDAEANNMFDYCQAKYAL